MPYKGGKGIKMEIQKILLRQSILADIRAELEDALDSKSAGQPPVVSLGFQFWHKYHPEMLATLDEDLTAAWRQVIRDLRDRADRSLDDFIHKILPAIPRPADQMSWMKKATTALFVGVPTAYDHGALPPAPLTAEDFMRPFAVGDKSKLGALLRLYPVIFRGYQKASRYKSPFAQRNGFECGEGWLQPLDNFCRWLESVAVDLKQCGVKRIPLIAQAKEKFGELTIYVDAVPGELQDEVRGRLDLAADESARTCEQCGLPGTKRGIDPVTGRGIAGWIHTFCDSCEAALMEGQAAE